MTEPTPPPADDLSNDAVDGPQPDPTERPASAGVATHEERMWAMGAHLGGFAICMLPLVGHIVAPLVVWALKREQMPYVDEQGREALNFQLSATLYLFAALLLTLVGVGILLVPLVAMGWVVMTVIGAVKAANGEPYRHPFVLRLID